ACRPGGLQHTLARRACRLIKKIDILAVKRHRQFAALGWIVERTGENAADGNITCDLRDTLLHTCQEVAYNRNVTPADETDLRRAVETFDLLGHHQAGQRADQEGALFLDEIDIGHCRTVENTIDEDELL